MRKTSLVAVALMLIFSIGLHSCKKKETCHDCHYENDNNQEVDLGKKCGNELEALERDGIVVDGKKREVHCHDH